MRGRTSLMLMVGAVALAGCDNTPFGDAVEVKGTYLGSWSLSWESVENDLPIGDLAVCPGSVTLGDQSKDTFGGIFLMVDESDCEPGSPVSGSNSSRPRSPSMPPWWMTDSTGDISGSGWDLKIH